MKREEYLDCVEQQIRWKRARAAVRRELEAHILDQEEALKKEGKEWEEAESAAIREMGNPKKVGEELDQIHRPKKEWKLPLTALFLTGAGGYIQYLAFSHIEAVSAAGYLEKTIFCSVLGMILMMALYLFDYRILGKYVWQIYAFYLAAILLFRYISGKNFADLLGDNVFLAVEREVIWSLFLPVFAAFIYRFRKEKFRGIMKAAGVLLVQAGVLAILVGCSPFWVVIGACLLTMAAAICSGIFGGNRKKQMVILTGSLMGGIATFLVVSGLSGNGNYFANRLQSLIRPEQFSDTLSRQFFLAREQIREISFLGSGTFGIFEGTGVSGTDFFLAGAAAYLGWGALLILMGILAFFLFRIVGILISETNRLGFLLSAAVGSLFFLKIFFYAVQNFGLINSVFHTDLPFLSYGPHSTVLNFALLGVLLSVYRHSSIATEEEKRCTRWHLVKVQE